MIRGKGSQTPTRFSHQLMKMFSGEEACLCS